MDTSERMARRCDDTSWQKASEFLCIQIPLFFEGVQQQKICQKNWNALSNVLLMARLQNLVAATKMARFFETVCLIWSQKRGSGRCCNLAENMLTQFFQGKTPAKTVGRTRPFREILVQQKGTGQAGGGYYAKKSKQGSRKPCGLDQSCSKQMLALGVCFPQPCKSQVTSSHITKCVR